MESGLHSSLHKNCHYQINYAKFNLQIYYPPPHEHEIWHYPKANLENIRKVIDQFLWAMHFANMDVIGKVIFFSKTVKNIIPNYIPDETIICDSRDSPWINQDIRN